MKKIIILISLISISLIGYTEDIIVFKDGKIVRAKIFEISSTDLKYKKVSNLDGPMYAIKTNEILSVAYENGDYDYFDNSNSTELIHNNGQLEISPDSNNIIQIQRYNAETPIRDNKSVNDNKIVDYFIAVWGVHSESIISSKDVEISLEWNNAWNDYISSWHQYRIRVKNKTNQILYIDLANTFKTYVLFDGSTNSEAWYDSTIYGTTDNSGSGLSLGLGSVANVLGIGGFVGTIANGIGVNSGKGNGASASYQMERILAIPPHSSKYLPSHRGKKDKYIYTYDEDLNLYYPDKSFKNELALKKYELRQYGYDESPLKRSYYITYSTKADFSNYYVLPIYLYTRAFYGDFGDIYHEQSKYGIKDIDCFYYSEIRKSE